MLAAIPVAILFKDNDKIIVNSSFVLILVLFLKVLVSFFWCLLGDFLFDNELIIEKNPSKIKNIEPIILANLKLKKLEIVLPTNMERKVTMDVIKDINKLYIIEMWTFFIP